MYKRVWTFVVVGGEPCTICPDGNLPMEHEGGRSVLKAVLSEEQAQQVLSQFEQHGATVRMNQEFQPKTGLPVGDAQEMPCFRCGQCAFLDFETKGFCGASGWSSQKAQALLQSTPSAMEDLRECPLKRGDHLLAN